MCLLLKYAIYFYKHNTFYTSNIKFCIMLEQFIHLSNFAISFIIFDGTIIGL